VEHQETQAENIKWQPKEA